MLKVELITHAFTSETIQSNTYSKADEVDFFRGLFLKITQYETFSPHTPFYVTELRASVRIDNETRLFQAIIKRFYETVRPSFFLNPMLHVFFNNDTA